MIIASPGRSSNTNPDMRVFRSVGAFGEQEPIRSPKGSSVNYLNRFNSAAGA